MWVRVPPRVLRRSPCYIRGMRPVQQRCRAEALLAEGLSRTETSLRTGIPYGTIRGWQSGRVRPLAESRCDHCGHAGHDFAALPGAPYAYLLGAYLGDGHIS